MRRHVLCLSLALAGAGCMELDIHLRDAPARPLTPTTPYAVPVSADQVNAANARQMAQQLSVELDRDDLATSLATSNRK